MPRPPFGGGASLRSPGHGLNLPRWLDGGASLSVLRNFLWRSRPVGAEARACARKRRHADLLDARRQECRSKNEEIDELSARAPRYGCLVISVQDATRASGACRM